MAIVHLWDDWDEIKRRRDQAVEFEKDGHLERTNVIDPSISIEKRYLYMGVCDFAIARCIGVEPPAQPYAKRDGGIDGWFKAYEKLYTYQGKYRTVDYGDLIYNPKYHQWTGDLWVLVVPHGPPEWIVRVVGWIPRKDMHKVWFDCDYGKGPGHCVGQADLNSMDRIIKALA